MSKAAGSGAVKDAGWVLGVNDRSDKFREPQGLRSFHDAVSFVIVFAGLCIIEAREV